MVDSDLKYTKKLYIKEEHRVTSFKLWPFDDSALCNVKKMAEAGFYWTGNAKENDLVRCFACGKVLNEWEANDDPWMEHAKHAPQCAFIKIGKPEAQLTVEEFIDLIGNIVKNKQNKKRMEETNKLEAKIANIREELIKSFDK